MNRISWDEYFMKIAETTALRSPDIKKVGAVVVDANNNILKTGFNGLPRKIQESGLDWNDRDFIRKVVIHAECNALLNLKTTEQPVKLYCTLTPCPECIKLIKTCGINTVYYRETYRKYEETLKLVKFFDMKLIKM